MIPTPAPREDSLCLTCLGPRGAMPKTLGKRNAHDLRAALAADPFCSTTCARSYYGTSLPEVGTGPRGKTGPKGKRVGGGFTHGTAYGYDTRLCRCDACRAAGTAARRERARGGRAA